MVPAVMSTPEKQSRDGLDPRIGHVHLEHVRKDAHAAAANAFSGPTNTRKRRQRMYLVAMTFLAEHFHERDLRTLVAFGEDATERPGEEDLAGLIKALRSAGWPIRKKE